MPHPLCIVLGNEKGGSGKSTTAMHLAVAALYAGTRVGVMDLDMGQGTLGRFFENRQVLSSRDGAPVPMPVVLPPPPDPDAADPAALAAALSAGPVDVVVVDTPGSATPLGRLAHSFADVLITPINDSFVDLDLIARAVPDDDRPPPLGPYAAMVFDQKKHRMARGGGAIDWVVLRNRLSTLDARNKRDMAAALDAVARRVGFRIAPGFSERVVFRELFRLGLTVLDLPPEGLSISQVAARQELRSLMRAVGDTAFAPTRRTATG